ncbi:hypothetical protein DSO57_1030415 [Entomophthora muscae]|uniref:Uncharacterized protein n=4 Tax=Entomophthora muscae TaxID=34485 RepID=A0ACC2TNB5_9FUNG|nr:hypothetical protein DSO57_1028327 [Entomophthora muscae]KAJ9064640.1 hypothetical protein DSO57_1028329 [Entomophthora muscae]KAJ9075991.1 hypothetical protein DSO57_1030413 [Entomophthora muscae]KAJ9075993.1 hypothetical protein DSO57_1030415 [Entomophthora muscae]
MLCHFLPVYVLTTLMLTVAPAASTNKLGRGYEVESRSESGFWGHTEYDAASVVGDDDFGDSEEL